MAAPTVNTITPSEGLTRGETFVVIEGSGFYDEATGGTVRVYFDGVEALQVGVVSSTKVFARTPRSTRAEPAAVDVKVENVDQSGPTMPTTVVGGFTYKRPSIATRPDHSTDDAILVVSRQLVDDLRRYVLANVHWDMHSEYVDALSVAVPEEVQAKSPSLKLLGPNVQEDPFYAIHGDFNEQVTPVPGTFDVLHNPVTVQLRFDFVGVGRSKGEAINLYAALRDYLARTPFLEVPRDGADKANGTTEFELNAIWEERADFSGQSTRQAVFQFNGALEIRGVHTGAFKVWEGADTLDVPTIEITTLPILPGGLYVLDQFTATAGQTVFNLSAIPSNPSAALLFLEGIEYSSPTFFTIAGNVLTWLETTPPGPMIAGRRVEVFYQ